MAEETDISTHTGDIELIRLRAEIAAEERRQHSRKMLIFLLLALLVLINVMVFSMALILSYAEAGVPEWLANQVPIIIQADIAGAIAAWSFLLSERSRERKAQ